MKHSKEFLVTTVADKKLPRNKCRYISKKYYEMGVDCFLMSDAKWHRINNGQIEYDYEVDTYVLIENSNLQHGVVAIDKDGTCKYGHFSSNKFKNIILNNDPCISEDICDSIEEEFSTGYYFTKGEKSKSRLTKKGINNSYSFRLEYSASRKLDEFMELYRKNNNTSNIPACNFTNELENKSFGFEFETSNGFIQERLLYRYGLIPLRDGSLRHDGVNPFEFTTIPLQGDNGVNNIVDISKLLQKYTTINNLCSLHVHIGGYKPSYEYVVALQRLMIKIQDEIYTLFPSNYKYTSENGFKPKDFCSPIKNIKLLKSNSVEDNFQRIYNYYSGGSENFKGFGKVNHPMDRDNNRKWNINLRYVGLNIIPFIWGKSGTIEWRLHPPTQNSDKIINWLFISNGILKYIEQNKYDLSKFSELKDMNLNHIMKSVYSVKLATTLINYMDWRKDYMLKIDPQGSAELKADLKPIPNNCKVL